MYLVLILTLIQVKGEFSILYLYNKLLKDASFRIDLDSVHKILELKFFNGESYKFSVCEKNYTHCLLNGKIKFL